MQIKMEMGHIPLPKDHSVHARNRLHDALHDGSIFPRYFQQTSQVWQNNRAQLFFLCHSQSGASEGLRKKVCSPPSYFDWRPWTDDGKDARDNLRVEMRIA